MLYQQELYEMLWLELKAWQDGLDSSSYDVQLISQRHKVKQKKYPVYTLALIFSSNFFPPQNCDVQNSAGG